MSYRNPIQYTSRTFNSTLNDLLNSPYMKDKPIWILILIAGLNDILGLNLNAQANNSYLGTAFTRRATVALAKLIDYEAAEQTTANGIQLFYLKSTVSYPLSIVKADLVASTTGTLIQSSKRFESRADYTAASATSETFTANAGDDKLTVARVYKTGEKVRLTTTGTLPAGLATSTNYYVIYVTDTTIRLATSLTNAYAGTYIDITSTGSGTHTITLFSIQVTVYQQEAKSSFSIGRSDGITEWQEFFLPDKNILSDTMTITINSVVWTRVDNWIDSGAASTHYKLLFNYDNSAVIQFGNGVYGAIPGNFDVYANYAIGGGSNSNQNTINTLVQYGGSSSNIEGTSNPLAFTGGADPESITNIQKVAPILLKSRDRFITAADGEALLLNYGGLSKVKINSNYWGPLSCQVLGIASGGGNPSSALKTAMQSYLIGKSVLDSIDVRFEDTTFNVQNITSAIKVKTGYLYSNISPYITLAFRLFFTECGDEIIDKYNNNGISTVVDFINNKWSTSFTSADYAQIERLITNLEPREYGETIEESSVLGFIDSFVTGVDYLTVSAPTFPITQNSNEITQIGTISLSEVI